MNTVTLKALRNAAAIGILALGSLAAIADEAPATDYSQRTVRYADLNLAREADARVLYARIQAAARQVCPELSPRSAAGRTNAIACRRTAVDNAVARVNAPVLSALHTGQSDTRLAVASE